MANGYVRYGNSIHLDGFQILDFCIENAISLESLRDLNLGRKVFLTGNDTNAGYLRENVWDGDRWRATAYLDDIDKITNGEGSLGTRVKALEDMLEMDDVNNVINTWAEIQEFFKNIDEGLDLMTMLDGKAEWNQNISSDSFKAIGYGYMGTNGWKSNGPALSFGANSTYYAQLQINAIADQIVFRRHATEGFSDWKEILHSGNIGDYAVVKGSYPTSGGNYNYYMDSGIYSTNAVEEGLPISEAGNLVVNAAYDSKASAQLYMRTLSDALYYRRKRSNVWYDWKTIAFTDSNITGNAATATALKNKVSLWGNEFDGTQSLGTANIYLANNKGVYGITTDSKYIIALNISSDNVLRVGYGTNYSGETINTYIYGNELKFYTGAQHHAMTITKEGNVLVGTASQTNTDFKFEVSGLSRIYTTGQSMSLGKVPTNGLVLGSHAGLQGQFYFDYNGNLCLQGQEVSGSTTRALNLNPLGGAVNVGEGGLNVNSNIESTGSLYLGTEGSACGVYLRRKGHNFIWATSESGTIYLGVKDSGNVSTSNASLAVYYNSVTPGARNNAVSLGISGWRWSNVYSTLGDFSGRVLIGGAEDDADYALITKGNWKLTSTDKGDYFSIKLRDVNVDYYGYDAADSWCNHNFISNGTTRFFVAGRDAEWSYIKGKFRAYGEFRAEELATFAAGAYIPSGQKLTIGSVTFEEDAAGRVKVDGDMYTTGTLASGGKAKEGTGTGSGSANVRDFELPADGKTTYDCDHLLKSKNVIVQVFEKAIQNNIEVWEMILTDVTIVTEDRVTVTFGRPHNKIHRVHIIGGNVS